MAEGWTYELTFRGETFELTEAEQVAGRSRTCDVSVPDASVSRRHAQLKPGPGHVLVQDLNSSNGTFINGRRIQGEDAAEDGDVLRLGDAELQVSIVNTSSYQTMRLSTATAAAPAETEQMRKPPGPATTMLAAESLRMAEQAELDRQAREAAASGQPAQEIPVAPSQPPSPASAPSEPPPQAVSPQTASPQAVSPQTSPQSSPPEAPPEAASPPPELPPTEPPPSQEDDSPLATQRMQLPAGGPPAESAAPASAEASVVRESREAPWAHAAGGDSPSPLQTQRFDSSSFAAPPAPPRSEEPTVETQAFRREVAASDSAAESVPEAAPDTPDQPSPLQTQRLDSSSFAPPPPAQPPPPPAAQEPAEQAAPEPSPLQTQRFDSSSFAAPISPEATSSDASSPAPEPLSSPAETQRLHTQPSAPAPPKAAPQPPPAAAAATVAMSAEQLRAARGEADRPPSFGADGALDGFDLDEPESSQVQPPPDFVPGSGRAWQTDAAPAAPEPAAPEPAAPGPSAPVDAAPLVPPSFPDSKPILPPTPRAPEPSSGPSFDRPVTSWAEKPPGDGDATFSGDEFDSRTGAPVPGDDAWEPPDIAEDAASFESSWVPSPDSDSGNAPAAQAAASPPPAEAPPQPQNTPPQDGPTFDQPTTPAAAPPTPPAGFDRPTPPAAPPPADMPREERTTGGAGGLLPTLDELDGAIAGPEMEMPYQPDPDPTAPVPIVTSHRSVDAGAGFVLRAVAALLDCMWISALTVAAWMVSNSNQLASLVVNVVCLVGVVVGWALWGTTPGKKALGLMVEGKRTTGPEDAGIGFLRAIIRAAGYLVSALPLGAGFLMIAFSKDKRGLHDRIAGTWVRRHG